MELWRTKIGLAPLVLHRLLQAFILPAADSAQISATGSSRCLAVEINRHSKLSKNPFSQLPSPLYAFFHSNIFDGNKRYHVHRSDARMGALMLLHVYKADRRLGQAKTGLRHCGQRTDVGYNGAVVVIIR